MTAARTNDRFRSDVADYTLSNSFGTAENGGRHDSHWPYARKAGASLLMTSVAVFGGMMGTSIGGAGALMPGAAASRTDRGVLTPSSPTRSLRLVPPPASADSRSDRDEISWIKESSGLTWDQLGKIFGVSRRAVHMWANGGRLNESNARRVREFSAIIRSIQGESPNPSPDIVRGRLLQVEADGLNTVDRLRRDQSSGATWGMPFGPERFVGAIHDPLRAPVGENGR